MTPGAVDPAVTQANIHSTICVAGYSASRRPPASYTEPLKLEQMALYHRAGSVSAYEEDHLVAIEIGGAPTDPRNLWPEPRPGAPEAVPGATSVEKDGAENAAHAAVCEGRLTLIDAQRMMASDWPQLLRR